MERWARIQAYRFAYDGRRLPLSRRLSYTLTWSEAFAKGAVDEYRKFIEIKADHPLALPSATVDCVWREHVADTRDYRIRFCEETVGKQIDREPITSRAEAMKRYEVTLSAYRERFGEPDPEYWPEVPFDGGAFVVNPARVFVISRGRAFDWLHGALQLLIWIVCLGVMAAANRRADAFGQLMALVFFAGSVASLASLTIYFMLRKWFKQGDDRTANLSDGITFAHYPGGMIPFGETPGVGFGGDSGSDSSFGDGGGEGGGIE